MPKLTAKSFTLPEIPFIQESQAIVYHDVKDDWWHTVKAFEAHPDDTYLAWHYLSTHPIFWQLTVMDDNIWLEADMGFESIDISMYRDNPEISDIDPDVARNTRNRIWVEAGHRSWDPVEANTSYHDERLDIYAGAATYEEAILELAYTVRFFYGNDRNLIPEDEGREPVWSELIRPQQGKHRRVEIVPVADVL